MSFDLKVVGRQKKKAVCLEKSVESAPSCLAW